MLAFSEKRNFPRMDVECPARVRVNDSDSTSAAIVKNISGGGMLVWLDQQVEPGSQLSILVLPGKNITPPLSAKVEVVSCDLLEAQPTETYAVACTIREIVDQEKLGENFP